MYKEVKIGDKLVPMMAMASVDYLYEEIFHEDPIKIQTSADDNGDQLKLIQKMGFVMAKFAELKDRKEMFKLSKADYMDWLDQFDRSDYYEALLAIKAVYDGQAEEHSEAKKNSEPPTAE